MINENQELKHVQNVTNAMFKITQMGHKIIDDNPVNHPTHHVTQILSIPPGGNANRPSIDTVMTPKNSLKEMVVDYESKHFPKYGNVTRYSEKHKDKHLEKVESFKEKAGDNYHSHEHDDTDTHHVTIMHYKNSSPYEIKTKKHSYVTRQIIGHLKNPNWRGSEPMMRESTFDRYRRVLEESEDYI